MDNLWTRRLNSNKISITMPNAEHGASTAFGLGSGAFASFGSPSKLTKTPGTAFDYTKNSTGSTPYSAVADKKEKGDTKTLSMVTSAPSAQSDEEVCAGTSGANNSPWPLKYTWVIWYRPPTPKNSDYEKSTKPMCKMATVQQFWKVFTHLKRPSTLPTVSDYHFFKERIRPVWEDEENRRGGKWVMRLKKGVSDRYWEDILMAMIGDQFAESGDEVCGAVLSVRTSEDVLSIWTKNDGGRNIKIRETIKRVLALPPDTLIFWKSHDDSMAQRCAIEHVQQEKSNTQGAEKRRVPLIQNEDLS